MRMNLNTTKKTKYVFLIFFCDGDVGVKQYLFIIFFCDVVVGVNTKKLQNRNGVNTN